MRKRFISIVGIKQWTVAAGIGSIIAAGLGALIGSWHSTPELLPPPDKCLSMVIQDYNNFTRACPHPDHRMDVRYEMVKVGESVMAPYVTITCRCSEPKSIVDAIKEVFPASSEIK